MDEFTATQQMLLAYVPRITASISFLSALYIVVTVMRNRQYRSRVYHRLMLGTALNVMAVNAGQFWGTAAVPVGTPGVYGAKGTTATCSAQGVLNQFGYVVPSYYCALSVYSYVAVRNNFKVEKYKWIERWIHLGVYVYPIASGVYLWTIEALNYSGHTCWVASVPLACGNGSGELCTRGPQNLGDIQWLFVGAPLIILMLGPVLVMAALYIIIRRKPSHFAIRARTVAKQSGMYLLALYLTYMPACINRAILFGSSGEQYFPFTLIAISVETAIGFWIMLVYNHLRTPVGWDEDTEKATENATEKSKRTTENTKPTKECIYSIFDGTNASEHWNEFIFDGDGSDEEEDYLESQKWESVVQR